MQFTLRRQIVLLAIAAGLLPIAAVVALIWNLQGMVAEQATEELDAVAKMDVTQIARDLYQMCRMADEHARWKTEVAGRAEERFFSGFGAARLGEGTNEWTAVNEETSESQSLWLPAMELGMTRVAVNRDPKTPSPGVDDVKAVSGAECTLFQRMNEAGDLLRVATTMSAADGGRLIGTYLPAVMKDGRTNSIARNLAAGEPCRGAGLLAGESYVTSYRPLRGADGRVFGAVGVSVHAQTAAGVREAFLRTSVGKTGYAWVLAASGETRGTYVISKDGRSDGVNIWDNEYEGKYPARSIIASAVSHPEGEIGYERYLWKNSDEPAPRQKISAFTYFKPWDWVIGVGTYEDEFHDAKAKIESSTRGLLAAVVVTGSVLLLLSIALAWSQSSRIVRPLRAVIGMAESVAAGDLKGAGAGTAGGSGGGMVATEVAQLVAAFRAMTESLASLIGQVQRSGIQVTASATQIAASAHELEATVAEQAASTRQVKDTAKEIAATSEGLENTMQGVTRTVEETASTAEAGRTILDRMGSAMQQLTEATASISSKLGVINDKAAKISRVVTTINKISDQTNLLSLNAAIEAEKAGEHGKGFSVVAREISRLADQTAMATQDIDQVVKEMQGSVSAGVMEMDRFADEVRRGVEEVGAVADQLGAIIDKVRALAPEFGSVEGGMQAQVEGARQISEAMEQLAQAAEQTRASLGEFRQATGQMNDAVSNLRGEVARFRVAGEGA